jgi:hypothetical protein
MNAKNEALQGTGRTQESALVQKARPLQSLAQSKLTLPELKILDAYLARINSREPERRTVRFEKGELEQYLGVTRILKPDLDKRLRHLFQAVELKEQNAFKLISLFEEAEAEQDDSGLWQITLTCTPAARKYIFNIENLGYLQYRLRTVINLTSRYTYVMFLYLEKNRHWKTWTVTLEQLRCELNCDAESYAAYKEFNDKILKRCQRELQEKTDVRYVYEPMRSGRKVSSIRFTMQTQSDLLQPPEQVSELDEQLIFGRTLPDAYDEDEAMLEKYGSENLAFIAGACDYEFSREDMRVIYDLVIQIVPSGGTERYDYLLRKYHVLKQYAAKNTIKHRSNYLIKLLRDDLQE